MASVPPPQTTPGGPAPVAAPDSARQDRGDTVPWGAWAAPAAVVVGGTGGVFATLLVAIFAGGAGSSLRHPTPAVTLIGDVVFDLSFVAAALYFASLHARPRPVDFGFRTPPLGLAVKAFLIAGVSYYALTAVYASLIGLHGGDKLPSDLGVNRSTAALVGAALFVCVVAPIAEEFFFRGFFFGSLISWRGPWVAAILTSLLFGLAHTGSASPQYLIPLAFLGFVLCMVRWRTGSLYPCMALHATNNGLALGINELHWSAAAVIGLILGANLVVALLTWPLADRGSTRRRALAT